MLIAMPMVLVSVMTTGHRSEPPSRSLGMLTALSIWESAGLAVVNVMDQTATNVIPAKNTPPKSTAPVSVMLTGLERTAASTTVHVTQSATRVWDPGPLAVSPAFLMPTKTDLARVFAKTGIEATARVRKNRAPATGMENSVTPGSAPVPLDVAHAPPDTSPSSVNPAVPTPSGTKTESVAVTTTGLATSARNTSESAIAAVTAAMAQPTVAVTIVRITLPLIMASVYAMTDGLDLTAHSGRVAVTTNVLGAMTRPQLTDLDTPSSTVFTV